MLPSGASSGAGGGDCLPVAAILVMGKALAKIPGVGYQPALMGDMLPSGASSGKRARKPAYAMP
ncbi:hypothetical protein [uncultured Anaerovibrio sp.]|uniref:hypothetical protein n=1 Tax=uncultured Anaerovibrio sp. TaxID=361586 RepID=UPI00262B766D|nr:hypothetical protein [uncultured Anaerovibrio sp.]